MINASIVGDKKVISRMKARHDKLMPAITRTMTAEAIKLVRYIQTQKLQSSPLHHRSGRLQGSIKQTVTAQAQGVIAKVYTNVKYAAIHEYGGKTPPHKIFPKKGNALKFKMGGKTVFSKSVNHPGSKMPMRSFMRSSLAENREKIQRALTSTIKGVMRES